MQVSEYGVVHLFSWVQLHFNLEDLATRVTLALKGIVMPAICFSAPAVVFDFNHTDSSGEATVVDDATVLKSLDGIEHDEIFADYISDGGDRTLANAGVTGGKLVFRFDASSKTLVGITEYHAPRNLSNAELSLLKEYTIGQWSDGIGSNFFQNRMMGEGLAPQLLFFDDTVVKAEQLG